MKHIRGLRLPAVAFCLVPQSDLTWQGECAVVAKADPGARINDIELMLKHAPEPKDAHLYTGASNGFVFGGLTTYLSKIRCPAAIGISLQIAGPVVFVQYDELAAYAKLLRIARAQVKATAASGRLPGVTG